MSAKTPYLMKFLKVMGWSFFLFFCLTFFLTIGIFPLEIIYYLCFGWISFIGENLDQVFFNSTEILMAISLFGALVFGLHIFLTSFFMNANVDKELKWTIKKSYYIVLTFFLLFLTSIAATGAIHQIIWMSKESFFSESRFQRHIEYTFHVDIREYYQYLKKEKDAFPDLPWKVIMKKVQTDEGIPKSLRKTWAETIQVLHSGNTMIFRSFGDDGTIGTSRENGEDIVLIFRHGEMLFP
jgi:hypothetical protein